MNLSRHPMHKKEDREEQHQWLEGIKNPCAITIEWIDKTNLRDNPRGILSIHEESSLEFENERNNSEHGSYFINTSPSPCSYKTSPQSICHRTDQIIRVQVQKRSSKNQVSKLEPI